MQSIQKCGCRGVGINRAFIPLERPLELVPRDPELLEYHPYVGIVLIGECSELFDALVRLEHASQCEHIYLAQGQGPLRLVFSSCTFQCWMACEPPILDTPTISCSAKPALFAISCKIGAINQAWKLLPQVNTCCPRSVEGEKLTRSCASSRRSAGTSSRRTTTAEDFFHR